MPGNQAASCCVPLPVLSSNTNHPHSFLWSIFDRLWQWPITSPECVGLAQLLSLPTMKLSSDMVGKSTTAPVRLAVAPPPGYLSGKEGTSVGGLRLPRFCLHRSYVNESIQHRVSWHLQPHDLYKQYLLSTSGLTRLQFQGYVGGVNR